MIIDGILGSEALDSSGEILDVHGADISDLVEGRGVLNYEHKGVDEKESNGQEIVGKIIYAKKIYSPQDCSNAREQMFFNMVGLPIIYGISRLYDGAGHAGAQALAAQIRDHNANNEPILVRYSVEGSTLERDPQNKQKIDKSIIRRVALTLKPCNKSAHSGLLLDPKAPEGFETKPDPSKIAGLVTEKFEHPSFVRITSFEGEYNPTLGEIPECVFKNEHENVAKALGADMGAAVTPPSARVQYLGKVLTILEKHKEELWKKRVIDTIQKWDGAGDFDTYMRSELRDLDEAQIGKLLEALKHFNMQKAETLILKMEALHIEHSHLTARK